ncbi:MAG: LON peptidase substrate-binding domain-containing protein, partial [Asticcacaulis sp.]|nr:LON peptidase substrate-binding domain-containing protein [Asticcacaulis sp.]
MLETLTIPVLPLRDIVVFPHMVVPLFVGREKSVHALDEVMRGNKQILLATQKNSSDDDPDASAIYEIGVLANVLQLYKGERPIFDLYSIDDEIAKALGRRVDLKSGGYLIVD